MREGPFEEIRAALLFEVINTRSSSDRVVVLDTTSGMLSTVQPGRYRFRYRPHWEKGLYLWANCFDECTTGELASDFNHDLRHNPD